MSGCNSTTQSTNGSRWAGGIGYVCNISDDGAYGGGSGGAGWYGGGGGSAWSGGGGGSSYGSTRRNGIINKNQQGTYSGTTSQIFLEW